MPQQLRSVMSVTKTLSKVLYIYILCNFICYYDDKIGEACNMGEEDEKCMQVVLDESKGML